MSSKYYKCPYCDYKNDRDKLATHIENNHEQLIPEGYSADRVVFNLINKKDHGNCVVCGKVTTWNTTTGKYNRLCGNPKCRKVLREKYSSNMYAIYNTDNILTNAEMQEKMLANRKISGKYKFSDGAEVVYTGSYEKRALEFMDKVMMIPSSDIMAPGPILKYDFNGETHQWITDIYYIPDNLIIEVKDGGSNPNNRSMPEYRAKQLAKEKVICADNSKFNYIRLTNNDFSQLLSVIAQIKYNYLNNIESKVHQVNENAAMGAIPPDWCNDIYMMTYRNKYEDDYKDIAITNNLVDLSAIGIKDGKLCSIKLDSEKEAQVFRFVGDKNNYKKLLEAVGTDYTKEDIYKTLTGKYLLSSDQIYFDKELELIDQDKPLFDITIPEKTLEDKISESLREAAKYAK